MGRRKTTEEFIASAKKLYGDRYDYSKVEYHGYEKKVCIVCPEHGEWWVSPHNFLNGHKCPTCSGRQRITRDVFIYRSREIHENRYDYSKVEYKGLNTPVCIICPVHGEFWQKPSGHLNGNGCQQCFSSPKSNTDEFINKAKSVYGEKYDYSKYKTIKLYHSKTEQTEEINLDDYLYGVVSSEMPASYEMEALKAQAIVARTYTIYQIIHSARKTWKCRYL